MYNRIRFAFLSLFVGMLLFVALPSPAQTALPRPSGYQTPNPSATPRPTPFVYCRVNCSFPPIDSVAITGDVAGETVASAPSLLPETSQTETQSADSILWSLVLVGVVSLIGLGTFMLFVVLFSDIEKFK